MYFSPNPNNIGTNGNAERTEKQENVKRFYKQWIFYVLYIHIHIYLYICGICAVHRYIYGSDITYIRKKNIQINTMVESIFLWTIECLRDDVPADHDILNNNVSHMCIILYIHEFNIKCPCGYMQTYVLFFSHYVPTLQSLITQAPPTTNWRMKKITMCLWIDVYGEFARCVCSIFSCQSCQCRTQIIW